VAIPKVRHLIEAGVHFGHRASRWHPAMAKYIFGKNKLIHIIDLKSTVRGLVTARKLLTAASASGEQVLFVGTKRQARPIVRRYAQACEMPYVAERWLGGLLTNFRTIRSRMRRLEELETMEEDGTFEELSKKRVSVLRREMHKLQKNFEGIRHMKKLPSVVMVIDPRKEHNAVLEARKLDIPVIALLDTDCNPNRIDIPIPGNDDALRSIDVVMRSLTDAVIAGRAERMGGGEQLQQVKQPEPVAPPEPSAMQEAAEQAAGPEQVS
jgi:small subunit ribosomal protein S2